MSSLTLHLCIKMYMCTLKKNTDIIKNFNYPHNLLFYIHLLKILQIYNHTPSYLYHLN
jgi:hypothetical protein